MPHESRRISTGAFRPASAIFPSCWGRGPRVSPYLRILRQRRTVILAEVNAEGARLYRYFGGTLESLEHLRSHVTLEPHYHMGSMPRQGFHTGTRGSTGTDAVQRQLRAGTQRMLRELAHRLAVLAGDDGWIVIGGTPLPAKAARAALPEGLAGRTLVMSEMHIWASEARMLYAYGAFGSSSIERFA